MNTDIADKAQELNRMVHSEMEVGFLDEDGPEEPDDEEDELLTAPTGQAVETGPVDEVQPPPGLVLQEQEEVPLTREVSLDDQDLVPQEQVAEPLAHVEVSPNGGNLVLQEQEATPLTHVEVSLNNEGTDFVVVEEPKRKRRLSIMKHKGTAMGGDQ